MRLAVGLSVPPSRAAGALAAAVAAPSDEEKRLLPLVHGGLARAVGAPGEPALAPEVARALRRGWAESRSLRLLALRQAGEVLAALEDVGIVAAPLKGLALDAWYGGAGRAVGDLDLLVPEERLAAAVRRLRAAGYELRDEPRPGAPRAKHSCALGRDAAAEVDLHWLLDVRLVLEAGAAGRRRAMERYWRGARRVRWSGREVLRLRPEHHLLHAVLHGARVDSRAQARWWVDAVTILRAEGTAFDWDEVVAAAREAGLGRWVAGGLDVLASLVPEAVPAAARRAAAARPAGAAAAVLRLLDRRAAPEGLARDVQRTLRWHLARHRHLGLARALWSYPSDLRATGLITSPRDLLAHARRRRRESRARRRGNDRGVGA